MRRSAAACLLFGLLLWPAEAHLSRVHYQKVSLSRLVGWSELIVVAEPTGEGRRIEVPIEGPGGKEVPAFVFSARPYRVHEVLKGKLDDAARERLEVSGAYLGRKFSLHKRYYVERVSKSPIYDRYEPEKPPTEGKRILFLRRVSFEGESRFVFTVSGAVEHLEARAKVAAALAADD